MKLLTEQDLKNLPPLYSTSEQSDPIVQVKLFHPLGQASWYLTEFDGEDLAFGFCIIHEGELGYVSMQELKYLNIGGLGVERDTSFTPKKLSEVKKELGYAVD